MQMTRIDICRTRARQSRTNVVEYVCSAIHHFVPVVENLHCRCVLYILQVQQSIKVGHTMLHIPRTQKIYEILSSLSFHLLVQPPSIRGNHFTNNQIILIIVTFHFLLFRLKDHTTLVISKNRFLFCIFRKYMYSKILLQKAFCMVQASLIKRR